MPRLKLKTFWKIYKNLQKNCSFVEKTLSFTKCLKFNVLQEDKVMCDVMWCVTFLLNSRNLQGIFLKLSGQNLCYNRILMSFVFCSSATCAANCTNYIDKNIGKIYRTISKFGRDWVPNFIERRGFYFMIFHPFLYIFPYFLTP